MGEAIQLLVEYGFDGLAEVLELLLNEVTKIERCEALHAAPAPKLADWMEKNVGESLTVFCLPPQHRVRMRTSNSPQASRRGDMLKRLNRELKRRTRVVSIFPSEASLLRLASAVLMEIDEGWMSGRNHLTMETN